MRLGPSTSGTHVPIAQIAEFMAEHDVPKVPVTTSAGELIGLLVLVREDVERESTSGTRTKEG
jgi:CBS domain-containing protein